MSSTAQQRWKDRTTARKKKLNARSSTFGDIVPWEVVVHDSDKAWRKMERDHHDREMYDAITNTNEYREICEESAMKFEEMIANEPF